MRRSFASLNPRTFKQLLITFPWLVTAFVCALVRKMRARIPAYTSLQYQSGEESTTAIHRIECAMVPSTFRITAPRKGCEWVYRCVCVRACLCVCVCVCVCACLHGTQFSSESSTTTTCPQQPHTHPPFSPPTLHPPSPSTCAGI